MIRTGNRVFILAAAWLAFSTTFSPSVLRADYPESATDFSRQRYRSVEHNTILRDESLVGALKLDADVRAVNARNTLLGDPGLKQICQFKKIDYLGLASTKITDAGLAHVGSLSDLRFLDLSFCEVGDAGVQHLAELERLEVLGLGGTKVTDAGLESLSRLKSLRNLIAPRAITDRGMKTIDGFRGLTHLNLHSARVTDEGLAAVKNLEQLEYLTLPEGTKEEGLAQVRGLKNLKFLHFHISPLGDVGLEALENLTKLESINFNEVQFRSKKDPAFYFRNMKNLRAFYASQYELTDEGTEFLKEMPKLEGIYVQAIALSPRGVANLKGLTRLKYFSFSKNNRGGEEIIAALMRDHPKASISDPFDASVFTAPLDGGYNNPNKIRYDEHYYKQYKKFVKLGMIGCGVATFEVMTNKGLKRFGSGLTYTYLGRRFHAEQLIEFLQTRTKGSKELYASFLTDPIFNDKRSPNPYLRDLYGCIGFLGDAQATEAVPVLTELLTDTHDDVCKAAIWSLSKMGKDAEPAAAELVRLMQKDVFARDGSKALAAMADRGVPHLITALKSKSIDSQIYAAEALGNLGPTASAGVPELLRAFKEHRDTSDRGGYIGSYSAKALGQIGDRAALPELRQGLNSTNHDVVSACRAAISRLEAAK